MDRPPIRGGGVVFAGGAILDVGNAAGLRQRHPNARLLERPACIVLPGLINAHVHLELSGFECPDRPASFAHWLRRLVPPSQLNAEAIHESVTRGVLMGVEQCLRFGVTTVGDISRHCAITRPLVARGRLRTVSYGEVIAMARRRGLLEEKIATAIDAADASDFLRVGLTPHAPYSVEIGAYRRCLHVARERGLPLATHLAETPDESSFLADHAGPFRQLWDDLGAWDEKVPRFSGGPIRMAHAIGLLDYSTLLAHVNYCDDQELELLSRGQASVVYCPRTHAYFGHPPHRWRDMLARGVNVAIGTDSCASSPDLNLLDDLRLLRQIAADYPAARLWEMVTIRAARAIGMEKSLGTLSPGKSADFVLFSAASDDPLARILDDKMIPEEVWISGARIPQTAQAAGKDPAAEPPNPP